MTILTFLLLFVSAYLLVGFIIGASSVIQTFIRGEHRLHDPKGMLLFGLSCIPLWLLYILIKRDLDKG